MKPAPCWMRCGTQQFFKPGTSALWDTFYVGCSIIYLPKQERRQWADWNKSVRVGTCLEVSHMQPQLSAILSEWQHVKSTCVWVSKKLLDLEQRSVIKFLFKEGKKPKEILECMVAVYGKSAPSYYKVKFWSKQFKWRRWPSHWASCGSDFWRNLPEIGKFDFGR